MATQTTNFKLPRPEASDVFNLTNHNELVDKIDTNIKTELDKKADKSYADTEIEKDRTRLTTLESGAGKITLTLQNGWTAATSTPFARNDGNGYISLGGMLNVGTLTDDTTIFTLPSGYRPPVSCGFAVGCNVSPYTALVYIGNDGVAKIRGVQGSSITNVRLDGIRFNTFAN